MTLDSRIALAVIEALDDQALDLLADRLAPRVNADDECDARPIAYTVATLASEIGLSPRAVRGAIERRELAAVKRSGRWLVSADAAAAWVAPASSPVQVVPRRRSGAIPLGSLSSLAAEIDRSESERPSGELGRPPVRLRPRQHKSDPGDAPTSRGRGPKEKRPPVTIVDSTAGHTPSAAQFVTLAESKR